MKDMLEALKVATDTVRVIDDSFFDGHKMIESESFTMQNEEAALKNLSDITEDCPGCMLAAIRQTGYAFLFDSFQFKVKKDAFWNEYNADLMEKDRYLYGY